MVKGFTRSKSSDQPHKAQAVSSFGVRSAEQCPIIYTLQQFACVCQSTGQVLASCRTWLGLQLPAAAGALMHDASHAVMVCTISCIRALIPTCAMWFDVVL